MQRFLSTLSMRRATSHIEYYSIITYNFYPRSPCGERRMRDLLSGLVEDVFLSTLSMRRATYHTVTSSLTLPFLSTLSMRRATMHWFKVRWIDRAISIHALHAESDDLIDAATAQQELFLSTLSMRRATRWASLRYR